jgi:hypothetical protein
MPPTTYLLATRDPELLRAWWVVVPAGARVVTLNEIVQSGAVIVPGLPTIMVAEESVLGELPESCLELPMVFVGDRNGDTYERLALSSTGTRVCLSHQDSQLRLGEFLPLLEEIAARGSAAKLLWNQKKRATTDSEPARVSEIRRDPSGTWWGWMGDAVESMGSREELLGEFRRMAKRALRTSHVVFFLRDDAGYRADRGEFFCAGNDALSQYLTLHPVAIDGNHWATDLNPVAELSIRQRMAAWSVRLIVPLHDNGRLAGWMAVGVRDDGLAYEEIDVGRAANIARLLRQMLGAGGASTRGASPAHAGQGALVAKYFPGMLILGRDESPPENTPAGVRTLIADVRKLKIARRLTPTAGQPFRASAGVVAETQGVWVSWEDATDELVEQHRRERAERLALLHDLALTLNHELGNSLVSLATLRQNPGAETNSPVLLAAIRRDIAALESINRHLASLPTFSEVMAESVDLRALISSVGRKTGISVETGSKPVLLDIAPRLIEFGLESIIDSIAENRPGLGKRELAISLRTAVRDSSPLAVLSIRGAALALEGILPPPEAGATPTHGRIGVFIAKEIVRLHGGTIEAGTGTNGPEILITLSRW